MKLEVTMPEKNKTVKAYKKVISIVVSFFISSKNNILDLFNNIYMGKELINILY